MQCPFLKETQARYCHASAAVRKMIVTPAAGNSGKDKCDSKAHAGCGVFRQQCGEHCEAQEQCPFLHETQVQFCAIAPVTKLIPYSESVLSRCGGTAHTYCDLYMSLAHPGAGGDADPSVEGVSIPRKLRFADNHMWLDASEDHSCHIGVDGFLARVAGHIDRISYLTPQGVQRPSVMLTIQGVDWPLVFPRPMLISAVNQYLRANPSRLITDPYRAGWLFEGWELPAGPSTIEGLRQGSDAVTWMGQEIQRTSEFVHELVAQRDGGEPATLNDGGVFMPGVVQQLKRDEVMRLMHSISGMNGTQK